MVASLKTNFPAPTVPNQKQLYVIVVWVYVWVCSRVQFCKVACRTKRVHKSPPALEWMAEALVVSGSPDTVSQSTFTEDHP